MRVLTMMMSAALLLTFIAGEGQTDAVREVLLIRPADVTARVEADTTIGQYYTMVYPLPSGLRSEQLEHVILELYVHVRAKPREGYVNEAPVLEVCALEEPFAGAVDKRSLDLKTRAVRPVALGENRRVLLDITKIVRAHCDGVIDNNGLVVGSLTGMREGDFTFVAGGIGDGAVGRVRVYTRGASAR